MPKLTPELVELIVSQRQAEVPCSQIARNMNELGYNCTKNSVIGLLHRLNHPRIIKPKKVKVVKPPKVKAIRLPKVKIVGPVPNSMMQRLQGYHDKMDAVLKECEGVGHILILPKKKEPTPARDWQFAY